MEANRACRQHCGESVQRWIGFGGPGANWTRPCKHQQEALTIRRRVFGDEYVATDLNSVGTVLKLQGNLDQAHANDKFDEALRIWRRVVGKDISLNNVGKGQYRTVLHGHGPREARRSAQDEGGGFAPFAAVC